jgi:hypothetical protein
MTRLCAPVLIFLVALPGFAATSSTDRDVEYLLDFVAASGCIFIRNGDDHSAVEAAEHLRMKYRRGQRYVTSAEGFIDRLASESSFSGKPYTVRCGDRREPSGDWLHRALADHRELLTVEDSAAR